MKSRLLGYALATALAVCAVGAQAALINVSDNLTISGGINSSKAETGYVSYNLGPQQHVWAGQFTVNVVNHSQGNNTFSIATFCTDVGAHWNSPRNYTAMDFPGEVGISPQWANNPLGIQNASWIYNQYFVGNAGTLTAAQSAGVQLAIWKALYDTTASGVVVNTAFNAGVLQASGFSGITDAVGYLTQLNLARSGTFTTYVDTWLKPTTADTQGLIWNATTPVPEPTTMIAGALLLLPFGISTLRMLRKKQTA